ncbi:MAG: AlkZ family DNA glycosylase [Acidobacteria bacterium]|nr:AlkZ family DNA glycosylase [Acidobacteriota bacterium]
MCRDIGGVQAQLMSAAEQQLWTRRQRSTRAEIQKALWEQRALVKTTCMRLTLHLLPAADYHLYMAALKSSALAAMYGHLARVGGGTKHAATMIAAVMDALADGPKTQQELIACAKSAADPAMRKWLQYSWTALRPAIIEGLICYGPPRGNEVTFVRVDAWLPRARPIAEDNARRELVRRFLAAYGPATVRDFMKWSGIKAAEARRVWTSLEDELAAVSVDGVSQSVLRRDLPALVNHAPDGSLRLLPSFDPFLLAHATKDHLIDVRHYKRVYRNAGWITPVVLIDGRVAGIWSLEPRGKAAAARVQMFASPGRATRAGIEREAAALAAFLGVACDVRVRAI